MPRDETEPDLAPPPPPPRPNLNDSRPNGQPGPCTESQETSGADVLQAEPASQDRNVAENSGM